MIEEADKCPTSGGGAGNTRYTKRGRQGWCPHCGKWRALTPGGKFKRHAQPKTSEAR